MREPRRRDTQRWPTPKTWLAFLIIGDLLPDAASTSFEECLDLILKLLARYQMDLALVYLFGAALSLY